MADGGHLKIMAAPLCSYDDVIKFWDESIKNQMADSRHFKKTNYMVGLIFFSDLFLCNLSKFE